MADPSKDDGLAPLDNTFSDPATKELSDDELDALDPDDEVGGDAAAHPDFVFPSVVVGPATSDEFNTVEEWIRPLACWRLDDTRFEFDSSFVKPGAARELRMLKEVRDDHPDATLCLFGQADPTGGDGVYNKVLSGRRARAIYGMLTRNAPIWAQLFKRDPSCAGDVWGKPSLQTMLSTVGRDPGEAETLDDDGRLVLYQQYMDKLCGPSLSLDPAKDFLAHATDPDLRGDVQGCSEFNAVIRFSASEASSFTKTKRDSENAPNRRVVGFLFSKNLVIDPKRWPCPAATKGADACRKRFFVDHAKRKANQAQRREFATDKDTFECRFYHRLAIQSPCETSALTSLQRIRVRLRLLYKDPMGTPRPFPKGFRVSALCPDGTSRSARVGDDGHIRFVIDRPKLSFSLEFDRSENIHFGSAPAGSSAKPTEKLLFDDDLDQAIKDGFRFFKVPHAWSTRTSDWVKVDSPLYDSKQGIFSGIDNLDATIGSAASPVEMLLDPHWQYLRWVYFDRIAQKQLPCLPMTVDGFELADLALGEPDTRSNWTTDGNHNQCLPWIVRDERNRPDANVLIQLNTHSKRTFIKTETGGARKLVKLDESGDPDTVNKKAVDTPSVERLGLYDLPVLWKSKGYFTRVGGKADFFDKLGATATTDAQPLIFSLDDIVLVDDKFKPITWNPANDRVAIFSNRIHQGISAGLFRPESALPYLSQVPAIVKDRNYLADYPDWTRLIAMRGSLYDVFDHRVSRSDSDVVGARAAVRWEDASLSPGPGNQQLQFGVAPAGVFRTVTAVQIGFFQDHVPGEGRIGRMDQASLRCCDVVKGVEIGVNLHYLRLSFNFSPTPPAPPATAPQTNTVAASAQQGFLNDGVANVALRWNGVEGNKNKGSVTLTPANGGPLSMKVIWFVQGFPHPLSATLNGPEVQYSMDVWKTGRAFTNSSKGTGQIRQDENKPDGDGGFTLAHEMGHADSLADEYLERSFDASYFAPGYREYIPGGPYFADEGTTGGMMRDNVEVRNRHFWHSAEWLRSLDGTEFVVEYDGFKYSLPHHQSSPQQTFVTSPFQTAQNVRSGAGGFYDCWLYCFGHEKYSDAILNKGPFDGFLSVNVRIKCTFTDSKGAPVSNHTDLTDGVSKMFNAVRERLNGKFVASGSVGGVTFKRIRLSFFPRFLVTNNSNNAKYLGGLHNPKNLTYPNLVAAIEKSLGPTHFNVSLTQTGPTTLTGNPGGAGTLLFNMDKKDLTDDFPLFFAGMLGIGLGKGAIDQSANYVPIVQQVIPGGQVSPL